MIRHPLSQGTTIKAAHKTCACSGGKFKTIQGKILKVIQNHSGTWYYLDIGATVKSDMVQQVL